MRTRTPDHQQKTSAPTLRIPQPRKRTIMTLDPTTEQLATRTAPKGQPSRLHDRFNRLPAKTQAVASALALLPTLALYAPIARFGGDSSAWAFIASGPYFLAVLAVTARSRRRRRWALSVAAATFTAEVALLLLLGEGTLGAQAAFLTVTPIAYAMAWGIARRNDPRWWKVGLTLAAILAMLPLRVVAMAHWDAVGPTAAFTFWLSWPGIVAFGCLACWAADLRASRARARAAGVDVNDNAPYFAEYQQRTTREIPVVILTPRD